MRNRIVALILIVFISFPIVGCSNNSGSDITNETLTDNSTNLELSEDIPTETIAEEIEEIKIELIKIFDEKHNRYNFAYKKARFLSEKKCLTKTTSQMSISKNFLMMLK